MSQGVMRFWLLLNFRLISASFDILSGFAINFPRFFKQLKSCLGIARTIIKSDYYLCDFVVRDIKIAAYLESSRQVNFNLLSEISEKKPGFI